MKRSVLSGAFMIKLPPICQIGILVAISTMGVVYSIDGFNYILYTSGALHQSIGMVDSNTYNSPEWLLSFAHCVALVLVVAEFVFSVGLVLRRKLIAFVFCLVIILQQMCFFVSACLWALPKFGRIAAEVTVSAFTPFAVQLNTGFPIWSLLVLIWLWFLDSKNCAKEIVVDG